MLSLFKPKPMISVVLTREKLDTAQDTGFRCVEERLKLIDCKLRKLKRYSEKVFECNNLETLSQVQVCQEELKKKEACKAKKRVRICAPGDSTRKTCGQKNTCMDQGDICQDSDSGDDFNCNDINLSDSDEGSGDECAEVQDPCQEEADPCKEEKDPCKDECGGEEDAPEDKEASQEDDCNISLDEPSNGCGGETKNKKCQVMTAETGASTYLLSQIHLREEGLAEGHIPPNIRHSSDSIEKAQSIVDDLPISKVSTNYSLVIPIITTTSVHSLSKVSNKGLHLPNDGQIEVGKPSIQAVHNTCSIQNSESVRNNESCSSRGTINSEPESPVLSSKKLFSRSASKLTQNSQTENVERSGTCRSLLKQEQNCNNLTVETDNNKQPSIVYIVQSPSYGSRAKLPTEGSIHIDASTVYIQKTGSQEVKLEQINFEETKPQNDRNLSDLETDLSDVSPSVKLESKVSFQEPQMANDGKRKSDLSCKTSQDLSSRVETASNTYYESSKSTTKNESLSSNKEMTDLSKENQIYVMEKLSDSTISDVSYENQILNENSHLSEERVVDTGFDQQSDSLNRNAMTDSECDVKLSPNSFVSDCDAFKVSQDQFSSDCDAVKPSPVQFTSECDALNSRVQSMSSQLSSTSSRLSGQMPIKVYVDKSEACSNHCSVESQTQVSTQTPSKISTSSSVKVVSNNAQLKASLSVPSATRSKKSHNSASQVTPRSNNSIDNEESQKSLKIDQSKILPTSASVNSSSWQTLNQEISELSQKNETIAMFANLNVDESTNTQNKDFLVVHCSKCKELCIAKIVHKVEPDFNIWTGQTHHKDQ